MLTLVLVVILAALVFEADPTSSDARIALLVANEQGDAMRGLRVRLRHAGGETLGVGCNQRRELVGGNVGGGGHQSGNAHGWRMNVRLLALFGKKGDKIP